MLEWANNDAQPIADTFRIVDHEVTAADGTQLLARWYQSPSSDSRAAALYLRHVAPRPGVKEVTRESIPT